MLSIDLVSMLNFEGLCGEFKTYNLNCSLLLINFDSDIFGEVIP